MINKIKIKGFKSIQDLELDITPINILIGANGAGKSNFISFFKLLHQIYEQKLQNYIGNNIDRLLYFGRKKTDKIWGLIEFQQEKDNNKNALAFSISNKKGTNQGYIEHLEDRFNRGSSEINYNLWHPKIWNKDTEESDLKNIKSWRANYLQDYLSSFRIYHFHDTSDSSAMKSSCEINDNRYLAENGRNLAAYLYFLQETQPKFFKRIEYLVKSIAPFFDRFDLAPDQINPKQIELRWQEKGSDFPFSAYHLSDGTLRFIALATLFLQAKPPKVIIIDEPELGLHPSAINKLAAVILKVSLKSQVVISTQSVNLVDNFNAEDIITVDRENNQSIFTRHQSDTLKEWLEEYTIGDLWNKNVIGGRP